MPKVRHTAELQASDTLVIPKKMGKAVEETHQKSTKLNTI